MLGCKALGGKSVTKLSEETQISQGWIYEQKRRIKKEARSLDNRESVISKIEACFKILMQELTSNAATNPQQL